MNAYGAAKGTPYPDRAPHDRAFPGEEPVNAIESEEAFGFRMALERLIIRGAWGLPDRDVAAMLRGAVEQLEIRIKGANE